MVGGAGNSNADATRGARTKVALYQFFFFVDKRYMPASRFALPISPGCSLESRSQMFITAQLHDTRDNVGGNTITLSTNSDLLI